jgi:hypothetical protein
MLKRSKSRGPVLEGMEIFSNLMLMKFKPNDNKATVKLKQKYDKMILSEKGKNREKKIK